MPSKRIVKGSEYTVEELIRRMIVNSDNVATTLLNHNSGIGLADNVLRDFGSSVQDGNINIKQYTGFFRVLYNSSYLSKASSNYALALMSGAEFEDGLVAGVPQGVVVSHKFGERTSGAKAQLHDCGAVYHPQNPYLLCVMTRGKDLRELAPAIADISRLVYEGVDLQIRKNGYLVER